MKKPLDSHATAESELNCDTILAEGRRRKGGRVWGAQGGDGQMRKAGQRSRASRRAGAGHARMAVDTMSWSSANRNTASIIDPNSATNLKRLIGMTSVPGAPAGGAPAAGQGSKDADEGRQLRRPFCEQREEQLWRGLPSLLSPGREGKEDAPGGDAAPGTSTWWSVGSGSSEPSAAGDAGAALASSRECADRVESLEAVRSRTAVGGWGADMGGDKVRRGWLRYRTGGELAV